MCCASQWRTPAEHAVELLEQINFWNFAASCHGCLLGQSRVVERSSGWTTRGLSESSVDLTGKSMAIVCSPNRRASMQRKIILYVPTRAERSCVPGRHCVMAPSSARCGAVVHAEVSGRVVAAEPPSNRYPRRQEPTKKTHCHDR